MNVVDRETFWDDPLTPTTIPRTAAFRIPRTADSPVEPFSPIGGHAESAERPPCRSALVEPMATPDSPLSIATFNVNGIRAARRRGFDAWLAGRGLDVVALQELRCPPEQVGEFDGYHAAIDSGSIPGRNGVAILTREAPTDVRTWVSHPRAPGARDIRERGRYLGSTSRTLPSLWRASICRKAACRRTCSGPATCAICPTAAPSTTGRCASSGRSRAS